LTKKKEKILGKNKFCIFTVPPSCDLLAIDLFKESTPKISNPNQDFFFQFCDVAKLAINNKKIEPNLAIH